LTFFFLRVLFIAIHTLSLIVLSIFASPNPLRTFSSLMNSEPRVTRHVISSPNVERVRLISPPPPLRGSLTLVPPTLFLVIFFYTYASHRMSALSLFRISRTQSIRLISSLQRLSYFFSYGPSIGTVDVVGLSVTSPVSSSVSSPLCAECHPSPVLFRPPGRRIAPDEFNVPLNPALRHCCQASPYVCFRRLRRGV